MHRAHVPNLGDGVIELGDVEAHHLRDVLRMKTGAEVELFDDAGGFALARIEECSPNRVSVRLLRRLAAEPPRLRWTVGSAVPKGNRADWLIEKLSEMGTAGYIPLRTARSVVHPEGVEKTRRWQRLAVESARQSRRVGVMTIHPLTPVMDAVRAWTGDRWYLSLAADAVPIIDAAVRLNASTPLLMLIGPEGDWSPEETAALDAAGARPVALTATVLRVETAAIAAAAVVACRGR